MKMSFKDCHVHVVDSVLFQPALSSRLVAVINRCYPHVQPRFSSTSRKQKARLGLRDIFGKPSYARRRQQMNETVIIFGLKMQKGQDDYNSKSTTKIQYYFTPYSTALRFVLRENNFFPPLQSYFFAIVLFLYLQFSFYSNFSFYLLMKIISAKVINNLYCSQKI